MSARTNIQRYMHRCIFTNGKGNQDQHREPVYGWQIEQEVKCDHCRKVLATHQQLLLHTYEQLMPDGG